MLVDEAHLERAVNAYLTLQKTMAEGAGAAGLAAMLAEPERFRGKKVGLILCGGNIDPRILASIMVRELERESHIVSFRLTIPDRPGVLGRLPRGLASSAPISSRSITAGCSSTSPRAPSSTSPSRRATPRTPRRSLRRWPPTAMRCESSHRAALEQLRSVARCRRWPLFAAISKVRHGYHVFCITSFS